MFNTRKRLEREIGLRERDILFLRANVERLERRLDSMADAVRAIRIAAGIDLTRIEAGWIATKMKHAKVNQ